MELIGDILDSWDRQCRIVDAVASRVTEFNRHLKPSEDGFSLDEQLAHMHGVRRFFLSQVAPHYAEGLGAPASEGEAVTPPDLAVIKHQLTLSAIAVREALREALVRSGPMSGPNVHYDSPLMFLQHMVWHDGWHVGLIFLALRLNGQEPEEEWEEANVWGQWRTETW